MDEPRTKHPSARAAVAGLFVVNGAVYGTWAARIPAVKAHLDLSGSDLGLALLAFALGAVVTMPLASLAIRFASSRLVCRLAAPCFAVSLVLPGVATRFGSLLAGLVVVGAANGALDVATNAHGADVERRIGRSMMQSFHGGFSVGLLAGGLVGAAMAAAGVPPAWHFTVVALVVASAATVLGRRLPADTTAERQRAAFLIPRDPQVVILVGFAVCAVFVEVTLAEWGGVYLAESQAASPAIAASGFAALAGAMTVARLIGDPLVQRFGLRLATVGATAASAALVAALVIDHAAATLVALAICGAGIACAFPQAISTADRLVGLPGITIVSTAAYGAGLTGPSLIGFVTDRTSLSAALMSVAVAAGGCAVLAVALRRRVTHAGANWVGSPTAVGKDPTQTG